MEDRHIDKDAGVAREVLCFPFDDVGVSESDTKFGSFKPGFAFEVLAVEVFAAGVTATASVDVKIGTTSVLTGAITPTANDRAEGTLSGTLANIRGSNSDVLNIHATTDGSGALEAVAVYVTIRPRPMAGDTNPVLGP